MDRYHRKKKNQNQRDHHRKKTKGHKNQHHRKKQNQDDRDHHREWHQDQGGRLRIP